MPDVHVALAGRHGGQLWVRVTNHSWVPQPQLPLYAVALKGRRVTGAARASVADLAGGQTVRVELGPSGQLRPDVQLEALPTMFLP
jgi:hypothetical protein